MYLMEKEKVSDDFMRQIKDEFEEAKGSMEYWKGKRDVYEEMLKAIKQKEEVSE